VSREESGPEPESFFADASAEPLCSLYFPAHSCMLYGFHAPAPNTVSPSSGPSSGPGGRAGATLPIQPPGCCRSAGHRPAAARTLTTHDMAASVFSSPATSASICGIVSILAFWSTLSSLPSAAWT